MIVKTPEICGGSARIKDTRIPVWVIWMNYLDDLTPQKIWELYPHLSLSDINTSIKYAEQHLEEIEQEILDNNV